ncbi:MAG: caspase family protein [Rhizobiaceae bacterium]
MIVLTRRGVLLGATALSAAGLIRPLAAQETARANHAVLVACTAYPNLPKRVSLIGPNNDATLVREFLMNAAPVRFEPENITLLADGAEGAMGSPTHRNILDALAATAKKAKRDDFVYIHLSGHGSRQPAVDTNSETDGMDEIFLPSDTDVWGQATHIPNALLDNQIGAALDAIRSTGAFVWFVIDACHSGTATRAATIDEDFAVERQVRPEDLGIPGDKLAAAEAAGATQAVGDQPAKPAFGAAAPTSAESVGKGGLVGFYAAQTVETTPEMPLPKGVEGATRYGLFTYTIFSKIAESQNPAMTYRQLGQAILQQYAADARTKPTPLFDGDLDAPVFGTKEGNVALQWPVTVKDGAVTINAGLLHRLTPGAKLAILAKPQDASDASIGMVEVTSAKNLSSRLKPVARDDKPALAIDAIPSNAYARVTDLALNFALTVARPSETEELAEEVKLVNAIVDEVSTREGKRYNVNLVEPGKEADIRLAVMRENAIPNAAKDASEAPALWFLPTSGDIAAGGRERPPLVAIDPANPKKLADAVASNFEKIYRAVSLSRLAAASDYDSTQVSVTFNIRREGSDAELPLDASTIPAVSPGDIVSVAAKNLSPNMVDVNVLYIGSDYSITHMGANRMEPNGALNEDLLMFTGDSFGMERMVAVLTEAPRISEIADLSFLQQGGVPAAMRGRESGDFMGLLEHIGNAPASRAAMKLGGKSGQKGAVMIFSVQNLPRGS